MRSTRTLLTLTCLFAATYARASCPAKMSGTLQHIVETWVSQSQPGKFFGLCAVALDKKGNMGFACGGKADATHGLDHNTLFQIGSVTKTMTAALLARRVSEGSFQLSDRLDPHLPVRFRRHAKDPVRIQDLATHHSGLRRDAGEYEGAAHSLELFDDCIDDHNCLTPGNPYSYSNWAFQILGYTLAHEDRWGIDQWFKDVYYNVLMLNQMQATKVYEEWQSTDASYFKKHAASGHTLDANNQFVDAGNVPHPRCPTANPSGCLYSSPHDMRLWLRYMMGLRTPTQTLGKARRYLRKSYDTSGSPDADMGLAWGFNHDPALQCHEIPGPTPGYYTRVSKSGEVIGQSAWIAYLQDPNDPQGVSPLGIVVLANSDAKGTPGFGDLAVELLSKIPVN